MRHYDQIIINKLTYISVPYGLDLQRDNGRTTPMGDGDLSNWMMINMSPPMSQSSFTSDTSAIKKFSKKDDSTTDNDQSTPSVAGRLDMAIHDNLILNFILHSLVIIYFFRLELFQLIQ